MSAVHKRKIYLRKQNNKMKKKQEETKRKKKKKAISKKNPKATRSKNSNDNNEQEARGRGRRKVFSPPAGTREFLRRSRGTMEDSHGAVLGTLNQVKECQSQADTTLALGPRSDLLAQECLDPERRYFSSVEKKISSEYLAQATIPILHKSADH